MTDKRLRAGFDDGRGELAKVIQVFGDDRVHDVEIQAGIFVDGDIAEADHVLYAGGKSAGRIPAVWSSAKASRLS